MFSALAIAIHNFPEGMATFQAGIVEVKIAIPFTNLIMI